MHPQCAGILSRFDHSRHSVCFLFIRTSLRLSIRTNVQGEAGYGFHLQNIRPPLHRTTGGSRLNIALSLRNSLSYMLELFFDRGSLQRTGFLCLSLLDRKLEIRF
jgi:hypothetical protein